MNKYITEKVIACTVILQKRKERESVMQKNSKLSAESKTRWMKVMRNDVMSSEESGDDGTNVVKPLPWRSQYVNKMFDKIDDYCGNTKSAQARRQMKTRVVGEPSTRAKPTGLPDWAVSSYV